jgi:NADH-ubiquinone oxidoreductase chain 5
MLFIGSIALMGFPFLTGFYSKDLILEIAFTKFTFIGLYAYILGLYTAIITAIYSLRVFYITFLTPINISNLFSYQKNKKSDLPNYGFYKKDHLMIHEASLTIYITLLILSFGSIFLGFFTKELFVGLGNSF